MLLVLLPAVFVMLVAAGMFAADWGRVQLVRSELQGAADAAALAGARGIPKGTAVSRAQAAACDNHADGSAIALGDVSVTLGKWNTTTGAFAAGSTPADAIRVTITRDVSMIFGALLGQPATRVSASATALAPSTGYGVVGLDSIRVNSSSSISSYNSSLGPQSSSNSGSDATGATNGYVEINGSSYHGDIYQKAGQSFSGSSGHDGERYAVTDTLSYPAPSIPSGTPNKGSKSQDGGTFTLNSGSHRYKDLVINSGATLKINGQVTLYITDKFEVNSGSMAVGHLPSQLHIVGMNGADIKVNSQSHLNATIYAPGAHVEVNSDSTLSGSVVAKTLLVNSGSHLYMDTAVAGGSPPRLVK